MKLFNPFHRKTLQDLRAFLTAVAITVVCLHAEAAEEEWDAAALMQLLSEVEAADATFVETRSSAFLVDEIKLRGELRYRAPDEIEKRVESPYKENTRVAGDLLTIEKVSDRGESTYKTYSLASIEALGTAVEGVRATLAGNLDTLNDNYEVAMSGNMANWLVALTPKQESVREVIEQIRVSGNDSMIRVIETLDADGDESRLTLSYQMIK